MLCWTTKGTRCCAGGAARADIVPTRVDLSREEVVRLCSAPADICLAKTPPDTLEAQPAVHLDDIFRHMPSSSDTNGVGSLWLFLYCKACNRSYTGSGSRPKKPLLACCYLGSRACLIRTMRVRVMQATHCC